MPAHVPVRWLTVFLDFPADAFDAGVAFWREVTGSGLSPFRGTAGEFATLLRGASRVDTLCLDVPPAEFQRECSFWTALTGWEPRSAPGFTGLCPPAGMPVRLLLQRLGSAAAGQRVRAHVDFACSDHARAVGRHAELGARVAGAYPCWTVLADPAGREYCLVTRELAGQEISVCGGAGSARRRRARRR